MKSLSVFALVVFALPTHAEIITAPFTATVTRVIGSPFGISAAIGAQVTGSFKYDTVSLAVSMSAGAADFMSTIPNGFVINLAGTTVSSGSYGVLTRNNLSGYNADWIGAQAEGGRNGSDFQVNGAQSQGYAEIILADGDQIMFLSDDAVNTLPSQSQLNQVDRVEFGHVNDKLGNSIAFESFPVPEPSLLMFLTQSALFAAVIRNRSIS